MMAAQQGLRGRIPVVGLGGSAGSIKALQRLVAKVPPGSGIAWVVVLHLSPDHDSKLAEVLQTATTVRVTQVVARTPIAPDHIYVIPPNKSIEIMDDALVIHEFARMEQRRFPVDLFFRTLSDARDGHAACVVLSGSGNDGAAGLKRIKQRGGLALVQLEDEADHREMPAAAIATGLADAVLPAEEMPACIVEFFETFHEPLQSHVDEGRDDGDGIQEVIAVLRRKTGHDFSNYKRGTVQRRIERRMHVRELSNVPEYVAFLKNHSDEASALMKDLLISVTSFFRDPDSWQVLKTRVILPLLAAKHAHDNMRVWVAGCATGEEAYSIAMLLAEAASTMTEQPSIQVFGTDLDLEAIAIAREGLYSIVDVGDMSEDRLRRFFTKEPGGYRVRRELRELVMFAQHNVVRDPPFAHLDLVTCRNVLIYLNRNMQSRLLETFHFSLNTGGFLFLGSAESPDASSNLFTRLDGAAHIYESNAATARIPRPVDDYLPRVDGHLQRAQPRTAGAPLPSDIHQKLLEQYAPPSLLLNDRFDLLHASETAGRYLRIPGGEPQQSVLQLVRPELQPELRTALHESGRERHQVDARDVPVTFDDGLRYVDMSVRPAFRDGDGTRGVFLVVFSERPQSEAERAQAPRPTPSDRSVDDELIRVKAHLRATVEQYETQVEAAEAANEELQALNEELRSAAEELETSKEELQSVNEELTTVNQELRIKIEELGLTNNDFQNFINSTDIGTIFLDRAFKVKLFTAHARNVFNLQDSDVGRTLSDITSNVRHESIHGDVKNVLDSLQTIERELQSDNGRWHLMRARPYRTTDNRIDGVVLTFHDITDRRQAEIMRRDADERFTLLADSAIDHAMFTMNEDGRIDAWNTGAERMFGYTQAEIVGSPMDVLFTPEDRQRNIPHLELDTARRTGRSSDERFHMRKDGSRFPVSGTTMRLGHAGLGFAKIARDLTMQRQAETAARQATEDLELRVSARTAELVTEKATVVELLHRIVTAQDDERSRVARDLHDSLGQQLTALRLTLERHQQQCPISARSEELTDALAMTSNLGDHVDFLAHELRPPALEDLGLAAALPLFVEEWSNHAGIRAEFRVGELPESRLRPDIENAFYRIAQEALNNVAKHAHASRVDLVLSANDGQAMMMVEDDGVGFDQNDGDTQKRGIGLVIMRERALLVGGSLDIETRVGEGTSMYVRAPLHLTPGH